MDNRIIAVYDCNEEPDYAIGRKLTEKNIYCEIFKRTPLNGKDDRIERINALKPACVIVSGLCNGQEKADLKGLKMPIVSADGDLEEIIQKSGISKNAEFSDFISSLKTAVKNKVSGKKVFCALSGGVDSAVTAALLNEVNKDGLICLFVDHGLLRLNEADEVMTAFKVKKGMNVIKIDAEARFLKALEGVTAPELKRKVIGGEFIEVFKDAAKNIGRVQFLAQGTIYPDIVESVKKIKAHHNVGGLPDIISFDELLEPLQFLFKDEVRAVGLSLGLEENLVMRQPFPGPGLGVRVLGEVTKTKLDILRKADFIFRDEIAAAGLAKKVWQYFAVYTGVGTVGATKDEKRREGVTVALRAITTKDAMTAEVYPLPFELLKKISARITTEVNEVNRVVYDITSKPPATIEWE